MLTALARRRREGGFTLIELLVVVIIIAILAAVAVPVYIGLQNNAKKSSIASDVATTKLNVAAAITEDVDVASGTDSTTVGATVLNSHSPNDETITVTVAADKSFTVTGESAKLQYRSTYSSKSGQSANLGGADYVAAAAYCTVSTDDTNITLAAPTRFYGPSTTLGKSLTYYKVESSMPAVTATAKARLTTLINNYTTYESTHHSATATDTWANGLNSYLRGIYGSQGGVDGIGTTGTDYSAFALTDSYSYIMTLYVPKNGDTSKFVAVGRDSYERDPLVKNGSVYNYPAWLYQASGYTEGFFQTNYITGAPAGVSTFLDKDPANCQ